MWSGVNVFHFFSKDYKYKSRVFDDLLLSGYGSSLEEKLVSQCCKSFSFSRKSSIEYLREAYSMNNSEPNREDYEKFCDSAYQFIVNQYKRN